ncbi:lipoprotein [Spiroplasma sp. DGKH1]|uniref:lipoprotein n=1 Tax=Spiroplasma sp. DGKH1 TaxID=3050074 RepID=UPI0034C6A457
MKKLLSILGAVGLTVSGASSVIACNTHKSDTPNPEPSKDKRIITKLSSWTNLRPLLFDSKDYQSLTVDNLVNTIANQLPLDETNKVVVKDGTFTNINITDGKVTNGTVTVSVLRNDKPIVDSTSGKSEFKVYFQTNQIKNARELATEINQKAPNSLTKLSEIKINFNGTQLPLGMILNLIPTFVKLSDLPTKIPTSFDAADPDQKKWNDFVTKLESLPGGILDLSFDTEIPLSGAIKLKVAGNVREIINAIAPDLIHFHNFLVAQKANEHDNLALLLVQYLFEAPTDINGDGFSAINKDKTDLKTNLDNLLCDILQPWQNSAGEVYSVAEPLKLSILSLPVKWDSADDSGFIPKGINLKKFGVDNILRELVTNLMNRNVTEPIKITINNIPIIGKISFDLNLNSIIGDNIMPTMLKNSGYDSAIVDSNNFQMLAGTLNFEIQKDGSDTWTTTTSIDDILSSDVKNIRMKVTGMQFKVIAKDDANANFTTDANLDTEFDIDLSSANLV